MKSIGTKNLTKKLDLRQERTFTKDEILKIRERFSEGYDMSIQNDPIISEDKTKYAFALVGDKDSSKIILSGKIVASGVREILSMKFSEVTNTLIAEFIIPKIELKDESMKVFDNIWEPKLCLFGDVILGPLDSLKTVRIKETEPDIFEVIYVDNEYNLKCSILQELREISDENITLNELRDVFGIDPTILDDPNPNLV